MGVNMLTGTLPPSLGTLTNLNILDVSYNTLHGTIPPELGGMITSEDLYLQNNALTGTLPPELSNLVALVTIFAQHNKLSGTLDGVFDAGRLSKLSLIELGHNQLTGTVPTDLCMLPYLFTLVVVVNCFSGVDLQKLFACEQIRTFSLDGLHAAPSCPHSVLPGISNAYVLTSHSLGTVPPCLLSMARINKLHLSSNRLTGSLPANIAITESLIDLSLSHNKLTGTIPECFQNRYWYNLDLSYNQFGRVLNDNFGAKFNISNYLISKLFDKLQSGNESRLLDKNIPPSALLLRNNRLSDVVPAGVQSMLNISVLNGNLFTCNLDGSDLPEHDRGKASYHCGSESFNRSYYVWIVLIAALSVVLLLFRWWLRTVPTTTRGAFYASLLRRVQSW